MGNKDYPRSNRIGDLIQREVAKMIQEQCSDPRLGFVTVTAVKLSNDLSLATIFSTILEEDKIESSIDVLNNAAGFFRGRLAKNLYLKNMPKLKFVYDPSIAAGNRMESLLNNVISKDEASD